MLNHNQHVRAKCMKKNKFESFWCKYHANICKNKNSWCDKYIVYIIYIYIYMNVYKMDETIKQGRWISNYNKILSLNRPKSGVFFFLGLSLIHSFVFDMSFSIIESKVITTMTNRFAFIKHIMYARTLTDAHQFIAFT